MKIFLKILVCFFICSLPAVTYSQAATSSINSPIPTVNPPGIAASPPLPIRSLASSGNMQNWYLQDQDIVAALKKQKLLNIENEIELAKYEMAAIDWNHNVSVYIFWVVHTILAIGMIFCIFEFVKSYKYSRSINNNELSLSASSISLKTSLQGIVILVITLGFYSLFILYVYPIQ